MRGGALRKLAGGWRAARPSVRGLLVGLGTGLGIAAAAHAAGGTLTVCTQSAPEGFDIAQYESIGTNDAAGLTLYDQLVRFKAGSTEIEPALAERWELSPDGLRYTFHLRAGVAFHSTPWFKPTRPMNADDVVFSFQRLNDPKHPMHGIARNGYVYWTGMSMPELLAGIEKLDERSVRLTLKRPEAPFLANLAITSIGSIFSAEYAAQLLREGPAALDRFNTQPVGTGPFVFRSYQKDAVVRYDAHPVYWDGRPPIDKLIFAVTRDEDTRAQRVKAGECKVAVGLKLQSIASFDGRPELNVRPTPVLRTSQVSPNVKRAPMSDRRFRQALGLAMDRAALVKAVYAGHAQPGGSYLPPGIWSHDPSLATPPDLAKAKALLQASGYDGRELSFAVAAGNGTRDGELLQADWAKIGVKVRVVVVEIGELLTRAGRGDYDLSWTSWYSDNGDPDNFFTPNLSCAAVASGGNKSQWCHPPFDALIDEARRTADLAKRTALYRRAQQMIVDEAAVLPVAYPMVLTVSHRSVQGAVTNLFGNNDFRHARLD